MTELDRELWLARRLREHGAAVFEGVTDRDTRRERVRAAILENGLASVVVGRREGKPCTYAEAFELVYGEPLVHGHKRQPPQVSAAPKTSTTPAPSRLSQAVREARSPRQEHTHAPTQPVRPHAATR